MTRNGRATSRKRGSWLHRCQVPETGEDMSILEKIGPHFRRIRCQLGEEVRFGAEGFRVHGYFANRFEISNSRHEGYIENVMRRLLLEKSGAFIDIGVNVGQTLAKLLSIDRQRVYIGFEPQLACCFNVDDFLKLNKLHNACVLPIALSDANGIMTFYADGDADETASLMAKSTERTLKSHVQGRIGDEVLLELAVDAVCAIKIDVEGAELHVLRGLRNTLRHKRPAVIFEMLPNFSGIGTRVMLPPAECARNQAVADGIQAIFAEAEYDLFVLELEQGREIRIDRFELNDTVNYVSYNFLARAR
jgi:FkbM family methyltransferase